jgi:peptide/nickel transport system permease protein
MRIKSRRRFGKYKAGLIGTLIVGVFLGVAIFAPIISPDHPNKNNLLRCLEPPSLNSPFGRDQFGRDVLSRIIFGARTSYLIGCMATGMASVVGILLGLIAGFYGGAVGNMIMRTVDLMLSFPEFLVAMIVVGILGPGFYNVILSISIIFVPRLVRLVRASTLSIKENEYIEAAISVGAGNLRIMFTHILPNAIAPAIVQGTLLIGYAVTIASGLGFLGLGAQPPLAEWGAMLSDGRAYIATAPHIATFPGLAIMLVVIGFNLVGDSLRDFLDVQLI